MKHLENFFDFKSFSILESVAAQAVKDAKELESNAEKLNIDVEDPKIQELICQQLIQSFEKSNGDKLDLKIDLQKVRRSAIDRPDMSKSNIKWSSAKDSNLRDKYKGINESVKLDENDLEDTVKILKEAQQLSDEELLDLFLHQPSDREHITKMLTEILAEAKLNIKSVSIPVFQELVRDKKVTDENRIDLKNYVDELKIEFQRDRQSSDDDEDEIATKEEKKGAFQFIKKYLGKILSFLLKVLSWLLQPLNYLKNLFTSAMNWIMRTVFGSSHRATSMVGNLVPAVLVSSVLVFLSPLIVAGFTTLSFWSVIGAFSSFTAVGTASSLTKAGLVALSFNFFKAYRLKYKKGELLFLGFLDKLEELTKKKFDIDKKTRNLLENLDRNMRGHSKDKK